MVDPGGDLSTICGPVNQLLQPPTPWCKAEPNLYQPWKDQQENSLGWGPPLFEILSKVMRMPDGTPLPFFPNQSLIA
ncbi:hypothetical protein ASPCAL07843 [Aspergillus calidoustus]|uniref:Uncharacterized protein n=1 Tax=Aspergillus calidoustus TaxID=454130 RepID=A0A0U5GRQ7_ASPCI|nr:hypothetical protein ASPCAL07843 [Aspergillus calidoustus]